MKRWMVCLALLLSMPMVAWSQQVVRQMPLMLRLDVTPQGTVSAVKIMGSVAVDSMGHRAVAEKLALPDDLAKAVREVASQWRFKAPTRDGRALGGRTYARADMKILKLSDGRLRLALAYQRNGPWLTSIVAPQYPFRARQLRYDAAIVVEATVQPDGTVADAHVVKAFAKSPSAERIFSKAATRAMNAWKGKPMEVGGRAVATRVRTAIYFQISGTSDPSDIYGKQVNALLQSGSGAGESASPPDKGDVVAMDSPFVKRSSS